MDLKRKTLLLEACIKNENVIIRSRFKKEKVKGQESAMPMLLLTGLLVLLCYSVVCDQTKIILSSRQESELRKCEIFLFAHVCTQVTMSINDSNANDFAVAGESLPETSVNVYGCPVAGTELKAKSGRSDRNKCSLCCRLGSSG